MYSIEFYEDKNGKSEVYEYIKNLKNKNTKEDKLKVKKIDMYIDLLSEYGLSLGEPYIKKIENNIWELRPMRDRILFASLYNNKFILLNIFMKKTNKTPKKEIDRAKRRFKDYIDRSV